MFFNRFYGRIAPSPDAHDKSTLTAIEENAAGLTQISGERIWSELSRILIGNHAKEIVKTMLSLGLGPYIGSYFKPFIGSIVDASTDFFLVLPIQKFCYPVLNQKLE